MKMKNINGPKHLQHMLLVILIISMISYTDHVSAKDQGDGNGDNGRDGGRGNGNGRDRGRGNGSGGNGGLRRLFYEDKCDGLDVEDEVRKVVKGYVDRDPTFAASLLRLQFHDCFVQGCDASVLLKSTETNLAEREAIGNRFIRGFQIIDDAKSALEDVCPGVVSCADILALAARDAVRMLGSPGWNVRTGRRDGVVSNMSEVATNIPSPFAHFSQLRSLFASKGFSVRDLVIL